MTESSASESVVSQPGSCVGIDVSLESWDVHLLDDGRAWTNPTSPSGLKKLLERLQPLAGRSLIVLEATGGLERPLADALMDAGHQVAIVNPRQVRDFAKGMGLLAKTDRIDARVLALFGQKVQPRPAVKVSEQQAELDALVLRRRQLVEMRTAELNRQKQVRSEATRKSIEKVLKVLAQQIAALDTAIAQLIQSDDEWKRKAEIVDSAPGVGPITAAGLIAELPGMGQFNRQQVASLVGVAPFNNDSGPRQGARRIRGGRAGLRSLLYMATCAAVRGRTRPSPIKDLFLRLRQRGKPFKVAIVACMRKLLTILNTMVKTNTPWRTAAVTP